MSMKFLQDKRTKNIKDAYREAYYEKYRKTFKTKKGMLDYKEYKEISTDLFNFLKDKLKEDGSVSLPKIGTIKIIGRKFETKVLENGRLNTYVNWGATRKLWEENPEEIKKTYIYFLNEETDGVSYRIGWSYNKVYNKYKKLYRLKLVRNLCREFAAHFKTGNFEYEIRN